MPRKRTAEEAREYMRQYRASKNGTTVGERLVANAVPVTPARRVTPAQRPSRYECECEPELPCIGHGIQRLPGKAISEILGRLPRAAARGSAG